MSTSPGRRLLRSGGGLRRPRRHTRPQSRLDRNELTDVLAAAEAEGGYSYALACLLGLNGLRIPEALKNRTDGPLLRTEWGNRTQRHNAAAIVTRLTRRARRMTPHALRRSYITIGLPQGVTLRDAARRANADTTVAYDQSDRSCRVPPSSS